jgi:hypothetical protein
MLEASKYAGTGWNQFMDKMNIPLVHSFVLKAFGLVIGMVAILLMQNNYYVLCRIHAAKASIGAIVFNQVCLSLNRF